MYKRRHTLSVASLLIFEHFVCLKKGLLLFQAVVIAKLATSNGEARRKIGEGAVRVNDIVVKNDSHLVSSADLLPEGVIKLSVGRKKHALLKVV